MADQPEYSNIAACLERTLLHSEIQNTQLLQTISSLLHRSLESGRAQRVLGEDPDDETCYEYVEKVINHYQQYHALVICLERGETEAWSDMTKKMAGWANKYFMKHNIHGPLRKKCVEEAVPNAVLAYLTGTYHYDTDFDAWCCVLVQNVCRKYIHDQLHPNRTPPKNMISYDKFESMLEALADNNEINSQRQRELRSVLLDAIEQLSSEARRELIVRYYFLGFSFKEIAEKRNSTMTATYKMHFDALKELKEILDK